MFLIMHVAAKKCMEMSLRFGTSYVLEFSAELSYAGVVTGYGFKKRDDNELTEGKCLTIVNVS